MAKITKKATGKNPIEKFAKKTAEQIKQLIIKEIAKQNSERPLGVTIISVLGYIGAILMALVGIAMIGFGGGIAGSLGVIGAMFGGIGIVAGVMLLAMSVIAYVVSRGLWNLKKWAWTVTMILEGLSLLGSLMSMNIVGIIIPAIIVYYLYTKKEIFV